VESFQEFVQREACVGVVEFREIEIVHQSKNAACVVSKWLKEMAESERVSAIGASADRESYVHLGAWKALQRAADFIQNRVSDFDHMLAEYAAQPIEDQ